MRRSLLFVACTAGLLGLAAPPAQASTIAPSEPSWSYSFTPSQPFISADTTKTNPNPGSVTFLSGGNTASGSSYVDLANLRVSSTASPSDPDTLSKNGAWSVTMKLTDAATGQSANLTFTGKLAGSFSDSNSQITDKFTGKTTQTWVASNGDTFTVKLTSFTPPGPPNPAPVNGVQPPVTYGAISALVTVTSDPHISSTTPEPSTMMLSCLGLAFVGAASWRKRRPSLAMLLS